MPRPKIIKCPCHVSLARAKTRARYSPTRSSEYLCASPHVHARVRSWRASVRVYVAFMPFVLRLGTDGLRQKLAVRKSEWEKNRNVERKEEKTEEEEQGSAGGANRV